MNRGELEEQIVLKRSCLCVGLDSELKKIPRHLPSGPKGVLAFNKSIIDATRDICVSYKINTAFYEVLGADGWSVMRKTIEYIGSKHFIIADAKRGDIGNTAEQYVNAFYDQLGADAITLSPYMGSDSLIPFLSVQEKWGIVLALTSNPGSKDLQWQNSDGKYLFEHVVDLVLEHGTPENSMFVVGGTRTNDLEVMRAACPNHFFLVPGVGKQGGTVADVIKAGASKTKGMGLLINSSRSIIFASSEKNYADAARQSAKNLQAQMVRFISS